MFEIPAGLLSWFYGLTNSYVAAIALIAIVVMAITTPLTLKSTKSMLEMQKIQPEMRKLQNEYRNDRTKLNEEMMKLYQEHKVNPMASCLPIVAQMPVFIIMFRILRGISYKPTEITTPVAEATLAAIGTTDTTQGFIPRFLATDSALYESLFDKTEIPSFGLDLSLSALDAVGEGLFTSIPYVLLVVLLGGLYFGQQKMVAARAAINPSMSPTQQKLMQYLPVFFAVFQIFFLSALVIFYIFQTLLRILQQYYITKKFYGSDESLGRQAQRAGEEARAAAKDSGEDTGIFSQMKRDMAGPDKDAAASKKSAPAKKTPPPSGRVTPSKKTSQASTSVGSKGRPTPSRKEAQAARAQRSNRPTSSRKKRN